MVESVAQQKASLRRLFRQRRNALSQQAQRDAAQGVCAQFFDHVAPPENAKIAVFISHDGEIDLSALCHACWDNAITTYLPIVDPQRAGHLRFFPYRVNTIFTPNRYGIPEPTLNDAAEPSLQPIAITELDYLLMPLVAFDKQGNRLGMGGGYYDRTLVDVTTLQLIGVAHDCQQADTLPTEPWDIPLNSILTPTRYWQFEKA
ncbi:5-formyltetrahydrofolate cyclo-ligase [Alteromonas oceanisediminis]|uniref:5-formyltetrahydrofolate cyclo-ligase n=1 Tax=Alteromonas oceanisediminis TaxID=2836180 RepID=UPI001BD92307|nr:5-formyltetrahydrofolate cyclo-ligase [Alteromonas oceanisediminis]MBT0585559.1 5-formyltetrahydrofolate cyclo-ligase [Alteromonas oceanisediminis]